MGRIGLPIEAREPTKNEARWQNDSLQASCHTEYHRLYVHRAIIAQDRQMKSESVLP